MGCSPTIYYSYSDFWGDFQGRAVVPAYAPAAFLETLFKSGVAYTVVDVCSHTGCIRVVDIETVVSKGDTVFVYFPHGFFPKRSDIEEFSSHVGFNVVWLFEDACPGIACTERTLVSFGGGSPVESAGVFYYNAAVETPKVVGWFADRVMRDLLEFNTQRHLLVDGIEFYKGLRLPRVYVDFDSVTPGKFCLVSRSRSFAEQACDVLSTYGVVLINYNDSVSGFEGAEDFKGRVLCLPSDLRGVAEETIQQILKVVSVV